MYDDIIVYSASNQCNVDRQREGQETERKRKGKDRKLDGLDQFNRRMECPVTILRSRNWLRARATFALQ
jgi:hypothetical protein